MLPNTVAKNTKILIRMRLLIMKLERHFSEMFCDLLHSNTRRTIMEVSATNFSITSYLPILFPRNIQTNDVNSKTMCPERLMED